MLRTALRPRWLALLGLVLIAATGMSLLGQWQLDRARSRGAEEQAAELARVRPLADVLRPRQSFPGEAADARVSATGTWDGERQLLVPDHELDGRNGFWVLTPLRLADGSALPVVRGWVASAPGPAAPAGTAEVVGRLQPGEPPVQRAPGETSALPPTQIERVSPPDLIQRWPYPLHTGYLLLETPAEPGLAPVPDTPPEAGLNLRNVSYAIQWWAFAAFGLFFWWRLVRDDHLGRLRRPDPAAAPAEDVGEHGRQPDRTGAQP